MLFATAQNQNAQAAPTRDTPSPPNAEENDASSHLVAIDGGASRLYNHRPSFSDAADFVLAYDPTRPATLSDRPSGGFGSFGGASKSAVVKKMERTYDNKSLTELRQLAKGAVLSLVPHKILYTDLVKEGINSQILRELYGELGLKTEPEPTVPSTEPEQHDIPSASAYKEDPRQIQKSHIREDAPKSTDAAPALVLPVTAATTALSTGSVEPILPPTVLDVRKQQSAPSPSLERKDRIAQLLAAKVGRPTPPPMTTAATVAQSEETALPASVAEIPDATEVAATSAAPQPPFTSQAETIHYSGRGGEMNKSKAQTELVKQKMETLKREAQARTDVSSPQTVLRQTGNPDRSGAVDGLRPAPQFGINTPFSGSKVSSLAGPPASASMIPGLFMSSAESTAPDASSNHSSPFKGLLPSIVPAKHALEQDATSILDRQPHKKAKSQQSMQPDSPAAVELDDLDDQSEGEVSEGTESGAMAIDQLPGQPLQPDYQASSPSGPAADAFNSSAGIDQTSSSSLHALAANGPGSDQLYRAKQSEIEIMRRRIAEAEQRNKLKRTRSQLESPASSKAATPPVTGEDQQMGSSPISNHTGLNGVRQISGARTTSKLTREQLQERAATLKADLLRQRAQRHQVLQEGLPDLNAEVRNTQTRLDSSRAELAQVRSQIKAFRTELDRLNAQEKDLDDEVALLEQQLKEGQEGQKQYTDELKEIKLAKLAEEEAAPSQLESVVPVAAQPSTSSGPQALPGLSNGDPADQDDTYDGEVHLSDLQGDATNNFMVDEDGDTEMQVEDDSESPLTDQVEEMVHESTVPPVAFEIPSQQEQGMQPEEFGEASASGDIQISAAEEAQSAEAQLQAALDNVSEANELEISLRPESYVEPGSYLQATMDAAHESAGEALDTNEDSDGSASMSGSDEEVDEDEYEPADADNSVPMQQSEEEDEYDPEAVPVESGTPMAGMEDTDDNYQRLSVHMNATDTVPSTIEGDRSVNGVSAEASDAVLSPLEAEAGLYDHMALSEVPANTMDDLESRTQLNETDFVPRSTFNYGREADPLPLLNGSSIPTDHYVPYKTPLSSFKSYRFHSDFNDTVKSGYRSLTFSNNIDPTRPLCPTELSGQVCQDPTCEEQHFNQLALPDEKILVQMSSASDIKDKIAKDEFHAGLKGVIAELRAHDVKDFEKVADALSKYRRDFLARRGENRGQQADEGTNDAVEIASIEEEHVDEAT